MSEQESQQRIDDLEREVAELRAQLGEGGATEEGAGSPDAGDSEELTRALPSRNRAIVIAVVIGMLAAAATIGIVLGLSRMIGPLSKEAAQAISPAPQKQPEAPAKAGSDPLRAPGL